MKRSSESPGKIGIRAHAMTVAVPVAAVASILYSLFAELQLTVWHPASLEVIGLGFGLALVLGAVAVLGGRGGRAFAFALVVLLWLDVATNLGVVVVHLTPWATPPVTPLHLVAVRLASTVVLGSILGSACWLFWRLGSRAPSFGLVIFSTALMTTIGTSPMVNIRPAAVALPSADGLIEAWQGEHAGAPDLPVVVHIILDELLSPGAIDESLPRGRRVRELMYDFGKRHGFRLYDSVYSRHFWTEGSLALVMNAEPDGSVAQPMAVAAQGLANNAHLVRMAERGYRTAVFQSGVLDWCRTSVALCSTYPSYDPAAAGNRVTADHARPSYLLDVVLRAYEPAYSARLGRGLLRRWYGVDRRELTALGVADRFDVQGFDAWFERFASFAVAAPRGTYVLAHFLAPHSPYLLTESCEFEGESDSGYFLNRRSPDSGARERARSRYFDAYLQQVQCVMRRLDVLMEEIARAPGLQDATIVIHGDHGSRISAGYDIADLEARDLVDNFATFFAIRSPSTSPGLDCQFSSLPEVFQARMHATLPDDDPDPVVVNAAQTPDGLVDVEMPRFGCAAVDRTMVAP